MSNPAHVWLAAAQPLLQCHAQAGLLVLSWPTNAAGFSLQKTTNLRDANAWVPVTNTVYAVGSACFVTNSITEGAAFFRLKL